MSTYSNDNKRIAKNTIFLYIRMFAMMFVALFTSRIVLDVLGATDYGINNIISGVVVLFSFLNSALLAATQRFLNFYLGKKDYKTASTVFCMSMNTYLIISAVVLLLGETIGLWFVQYKLNIPADRMHAAMWVYQFTIIQFIISLLRVPYNASIIAYEKMNFYAYISLIEVLLKFAVVYLLYITAYDKLIIYALLYTIASIVVFLGYKGFCNKKFAICRYQLIWDKSIFHELFGFTGWSLFGSLANLSAQQGLNILINLFYGVTVNAAAGIANQVSNSVFGFISNFQTAFQPQIIKNYANNEITRFYRLIFQASKFSYYMVLIIFTPIIFTIDSILGIWLKDVPEYTAIFCRLILVFLSIEAVTAPLWMGVQATGKIRNYQILMAILIFLNFPLAYIVLEMGYPPYYVWWIRILVNVIVMTARCIYMKRSLGFPAADYVKEVLLPIAIVTILSIPIPWWIDREIQGLWTNLFTVGFISVFVCAILIYFIGINSSERSLIKKMIFSKLSFIHRK